MSVELIRIGEVDVHRHAATSSGDVVFAASGTGSGTGSPRPQSPSTFSSGSRSITPQPQKPAYCPAPSIGRSGI